MAVDPSEQKTVMRPAFNEEELQAGPQYEKTAMLQSPVVDEAEASKRPIGLYLLLGFVVLAILATALYIILR